MKITNPTHTRTQKQEFTRIHIQFNAKIWQEQKLKGRKKIVPFTRLVGIGEIHDWK
jgi:hypothetical protein